MIVDFIIQKENCSEVDTIAKFIKDSIESKKFSFARVAVAYATLGGVNHIISAFKKSGLQSSQWVIGLSDLVTQPAALRALIGLENSEVKVATTVKNGTRFHPKLFQFGHSKDDSVIISLIGSANMTPTAFNSNVEIMAAMRAENPEDSLKANGLWDELWDGPPLLTPEILSDYSKRYEKAAKLKRLIRKRIEPLEPSYQPTATLVEGMLWWKKLSTTDAQQATSGRIVPYLRLTKSKSPYDTQSWFRNTLFSNLNWKAGFFGKHPVEEASVDILVEVHGQQFGERTMLLTHDDDRQYNNNTPNTWVHFDSATQDYLASNKQTGQIAVIFKDTAGKFHFVVQSEIP